MYKEIALSIARIKAHAPQWKKRVRARYHIDQRRLEVYADEVQEVWVTTAHPETAMRAVRRFGVPLDLK